MNFTTTVGSPEWDRLTQRRAELIHKKNRTGLSAEESAEYERLQSISGDIIRANFPVPSVPLPESGKS